jgi:hypothetical protein
MLTVVETPTFSKLAADYWSEDERGEFAAWIAAHPEAGDVVPGSGGVRKVRWSRPGRGKRGGVRVTYFNRLTRGEIWLLLIYAKSARETIPAHVLKAIKEEIEDADD